MSAASNKCVLCERDAELTEEHIPAKSAGNRGAGILRCVRLDGGREVEVSTEDGVSLRVLCARCNNNYGSSLGSEFGTFAKQFQKSGIVQSTRGGVFVSAIEVYPARVIRQLYLNYLCLQPVRDRTEWAPIREFIKSRPPHTGEGLPKVSLYFNSSETYRLAPNCGINSTNTNVTGWYGSEIAAPGLGVVFTLEGSGSLEPIIGKEPFGIADWTQYRFSERVRISMEVPVWRVESPHPIGFGRRKDVEDWRTRKMITWAIVKADDPNSINSTSLLWRPTGKIKRLIRR